MQIFGVNWNDYPFNEIRRTVVQVSGQPPGERDVTAVSDLIGAVADLFPALREEDACEECEHPVTQLWSGVKCDECGWWFCW